MSLISLPTVFAVVLVTGLFCYYSVPCLTQRTLRIVLGLALYVATMSLLVLYRPGDHGIHLLRFVAEIHCFSATVAAACIVAFIVRWEKAK